MLIKKYLGQILKEMGFVDSQQLEVALQQQKQTLKEKMIQERMARVNLVSAARLSESAALAPQLGEVLMELGFVTQSQLKEALLIQRKSFEAHIALGNEKLGTVIEIGALINSTLNLAKVLDLIMTHANRVTNSVASTLMLMDQKTDELVFSVPTGPKADRLVDLRIPKGKGIAGWVAENEKPLMIPDVQQDERFYSAIDTMSGFETRSILCVPLKTKSELIGVLEVLNKADGTLFSDEDVMLLKMFGYQAAVAIENARLHEELKDRLSMCERIEREMEASEKRYQDLFNQAPDMYFTISVDGKVNAVNQFGADYLGYAKAELIGGPVWTIVHPEDHEMVKAKVQEIFGRRIAQSELEFRKVCKDGSVLWVHERSRLILDESGSPTELWIICRDITRQREVEEEKISLETQLRQTRKMEAIGSLAGGIAHDFNNILFPMMGFAEMLSKDLPDGSPQQESAQEIIRSAIRARDLVKQILAFSRQPEKDVIPVKMQAVLKEALILIRSSLPSTIDITQTVDKNCPTILANPTHIHQLIMNLVTNAYHAMQEYGGQLSIHLGRVLIEEGDNCPPGQYVCLSISDTGTGMNGNTLEKIFDPYYTTKPKDKGSGLGLSIVYGIVKGYRGDIQVNSQPGQGSEFKVYMPAHRDEPAHREVEPAMPLPTGTEKILLVDDEELIVQMERQLLERLGYTVVARFSSIDALKTFKADPNGFDMVITDMTMPHMTGDILAKKLLQLRSDIPVILCTGYSDKISSETSESIGISAFLMKPVLTSEFARTVRNVLDKGKP